MSEKVGNSPWFFICDIGGSIWHGTEMPVMLEGVGLSFLGRRPLVSNCILPSSLLSQHWWQMTVLALCFSSIPVVKKILLTDCHLTSEIAPCGNKRHSELLLQAGLGFEQMSLHYLYVLELVFSLVLRAVFATRKTNKSMSSKITAAFLEHALEKSTANTQQLMRLFNCYEGNPGVVKIKSL